MLLLLLPLWLLPLLLLLLLLLLLRSQDESAGNERQTPVNPAQGLFGLRVATPPFNLVGLGSSPRGAALRAELAPVLRELGPEMREFGLQVTIFAEWRRFMLFFFSVF